MHICKPYIKYCDFENKAYSYSLILILNNISLLYLTNISCLLCSSFYLLNLHLIVKGKSNRYSINNRSAFVCYSVVNHNIRIHIEP